MTVTTAPTPVPAPAPYRLVWDWEDGLHGEAEPAGDLLAADSWLVENGVMRGAEHHLARFSRACADRAGIRGRSTEEFWDLVLAALPRAGAWFPRVELRRDGGPRLGVLVRPAPARGDRLRVLPWGGPDPRRSPRTKGPDIPALERVRRAAVGRGADDALLCTPEGLVVESTTSALLWWEDGDLCLPSSALRLMPSVTSALLVELARRRGVAVRGRRARLRDLHGCETWLVNALHGIRVVDAWTGSDVRPGSADRAERWREHLGLMGVPVPTTRQWPPRIDMTAL